MLNIHLLESQQTSEPVPWSPSPLAQLYLLQYRQFLLQTLLLSKTNLQCWDLLGFWQYPGPSATAWAPFDCSGRHSNYHRRPFCSGFDRRKILHSPVCYTPLLDVRDDQRIPKLSACSCKRDIQYKAWCWVCCPGQGWWMVNGEKQP